jgi:replicative DNA helicase
MENQNETFSRFGKSFQEKLCHLMIQDRPFCDQITEVLDINFLQYEHLRVFVQILLDYRERYRTHPSYEIMATKIKSGLDSYTPALAKQIRAFYASVLSESELRDGPFIKDNALDFCRKQVLKGAMIKSVKLIKTSSFDEIQSVIEKALKLGTDNNFGHDFIKDFEERYTITARDPVSTGFERIDDISKGGLGKSELGVVIAPTGAGKSMVLVHLGTEALKAGKTVVHYTMELADVVVGNRYDSCISRVPLADLFSNKRKVFDEIQDVEGQLIIKEYPTKSASTETIKNHIERLKKKGIEPDMIIVDYADLLRPVKATKEKRHDLENTYEELRAIAQIYKCPLWTASQTNRSGLNAEIITMEAISEAFNKCFVADFIFSLSRTVQDKQANKGRIFVAKNRNGPDGLVFPTFVDWSNVNIKVLSRDDRDSVANVIKDSDQNTLQYLKDRYKKKTNNERYTC